METIFITDEDKVQLVLCPNTELDRLLLNKLSEDQIEIEVVRQPVGIIGKSVKDALIIKSKTPPNAGKAEEV